LDFLLNSSVEFRTHIDQDVMKTEGSYMCEYLGFLYYMHSEKNVINDVFCVGVCFRM
jgi:hypothetical protein